MVPLWAAISSSPLRPVRWVSSAWFYASETTGIYTAKAAAAVVLMSPWGGRRTRFAANAALAVGSVVMHPRQHYGTDGSDQVSFLVQAAAVGRSSSRPAVAAMPGRSSSQSRIVGPSTAPIVAL